MYKILMLDFDGVLFSSVYQFSNNVCPTTVSALNHLLKRFPEMKLVISASYRSHFKSVDMVENFLVKYGVAANGRIHDDYATT